MKNNLRFLLTLLSIATMVMFVPTLLTAIFGLNGIFLVFFYAIGIIMLIGYYRTVWTEVED